jgi:hypothetical protein
LWAPSILPGFLLFMLAALILLRITRGR